MSGKKFRKKCMEKNPGGQKFWQRGEGRFREILSCPPQNACCPSNAPQIPRPGAATAFTLLNHYTVIMALAFRMIVNKKKAVTYCQQALFIVKVFIKCSLNCLLNIRYAFLLCHNLRLHTPKTPGIGKKVLSVSCNNFIS